MAAELVPVARAGEVEMAAVVEVGRALAAAADRVVAVAELVAAVGLVVGLVVDLVADLVAGLVADPVAGLAGDRVAVGLAVEVVPEAEPAAGQVPRVSRVGG